MKNFNEIIDFALELGYNGSYLHSNEIELIEWLYKQGILVLVHYEYECTNKSFEYRIYELNKDNGQPKKQSIIGVSYDEDDKPTEHIVGYRDFKISYKSYEKYSEALYDGLYEALSIVANK